MTIKKILVEPNKLLRRVSQPVKEVTKEIQRLMDDMLETMYSENGIGLAATQVNVHKRIIVMDISEERNEPRVFINPEFQIKSNKSLFTFSEGCLSLPGFNEEITRPDKIILKWQNLDGDQLEDEPEGLLTVCIQHEIDHLEGKLMVDYLSTLKRDRIRNKLNKRI